MAESDLLSSFSQKITNNMYVKIEFHDNGDSTENGFFPTLEFNISGDYGESSIKPSDFPTADTFRRLADAMDKAYKDVKNIKRKQIEDEQINEPNIAYLISEALLLIGELENLQSLRSDMKIVINAQTLAPRLNQPEEKTYKLLSFMLKNKFVSNLDGYTLTQKGKDIYNNLTKFTP
jgi:hypothetical protein